MSCHIKSQSNNSPEMVDMVRLWFPRTNSDGLKVGSSTTSKPKSESISSESLSTAFPFVCALSFGPFEPFCICGGSIDAMWCGWLGAFSGGGKGGGGGPAAIFTRSETSFVSKIEFMKSSVGRIAMPNDYLQTRLNFCQALFSFNIYKEYFNFTRHN